MKNESNEIPASGKPCFAPPPRLTAEGFNELASALARLHDIKNRKPDGLILTRDKKNEARELTEEAQSLVGFLSENFIAYGQEFLGAWVTLKTEYEPLINGLVPAFRRVAATVNAQAQQAQLAAQAKQAGGQ